MIKDIYSYEKDLSSRGYEYIAGTDEAGRGPMAGPLVVAACILPKGYILDCLDDSKKVSPKKREELYEVIVKDALEFHVAIISVEDVDRMNVYQASKWGMEQCIKGFRLPVDYVLSDAMPLDIDVNYLSIIKGDSKSASIAAASIIAKVTRDRIMRELDILYPEYGFKRHKGYVAKGLLENLEGYGVVVIHRLSFAPVQNILRRK